MKKAAVFPSNQKEFQLELLELQIAQENKISHENIVFLDRTIPDALAYYRFMNLPEDKELLEALSKVCYKKVFILDCLTLVQDYARTEDEAAQKKIDALISEVYESLPFPVIHVPVLSPKERVDFILKNI